MAFAYPNLVLVIYSSQEMSTYFMMDYSHNSSQSVVNWQANINSALFTISVSNRSRCNCVLCEI